MSATASVLPDFCRRQWVSEYARSIWEPRLAAIGRQFAAAERATVEMGIRAAALQNISPEELPELAGVAVQRGLVVAPLSSLSRPQEYAAETAPRSAEAPWDYRVVIAMPAKAPAFLKAWHAGDDDALGQLLGYPKCCRQFFARTWGAGSVDPTREMAGPEDGPKESNILLRWLGVRYVPHLPCGFHCTRTIEMGRQFRALIPPPEREWMDELLEMPMLWSSLHGVGEVVTPIVTLNFRSDVHPELLELRREGEYDRYPEAGARGLKFPYRPPPGRRVDPRGWTDNGFTSAAAMEDAHRVIASVLPNADRKVLDLGCGNGRLARRLAGPRGLAIGVELDEGRADRARRILDVAIHRDLFSFVADLEGTFDIIIFMPGRVLDAPKNAPPGFLRRLRQSATKLLVYAYGDWLRDYSYLENLCHAAGMTGELHHQVVEDGVAAGVWEWR